MGLTDQPPVALPLMVLWVALVIHGGVISYYDLRTERIRNAHILVTVGLGVAWRLFVAVWGVRFGLSQDLWAVGLNTLIALLAAFGMYLAGLWSPADAKWYAALVFVLPMEYYHNVAVDYFPGLVLLVNAYICAFFYIFFEFVLKTGRRATAFMQRLGGLDAQARQDEVYQAGVRVWDHVPKFAVMAVGIAFVMMVMRLGMLKGQQWLGPYLHLKPATVFLILFLLFNPIYRLMRIKWVFVPVLFGLVTWMGYLLLTLKDPGKVGELVSIGYVSIALILFRELYELWQRGLESRFVEIDEVRSGHLLTEAAKQDLVAREVLTREELDEAGVDGLNARQRDRIIRLYRHQEYPGFIEVQKTIPFGLFLYAGLLATMLFRGVCFQVQWLFG